jgi:hypothetical protein
MSISLPYKMTVDESKYSICGLIIKTFYLKIDPLREVVFLVTKLQI